ncbi:MAG: exo-alpha-sialidase, partial [Clostridia bacterium]|nr:exo-alpha-sialidase [Clostridia bacterium]
MLITDESKMHEFADDRRVWQGIPGIVITASNRRFICFYSGRSGETFGNYALVMKSDGGDSFGKAPIAAAYSGERARCFDPVLWIDPLQRLWFIWNVQPSGEVWGAICEQPDADELKWSDEFRIGYGVMMNKPTVLSTGEWLFPISIWDRKFHSVYRMNSGEESRLSPMAYVYKSSDNGECFNRMGGIAIKDRSFDEHMVLELKNDALAMFIRTTYGIGVSYSYDRGERWSNGEDSGLGGPCSRFHISRLRSGRILLINHHRFTGRNNLTALLSEDDGKTFPYSLLLDERSSVSYPDAVEDTEGNIHIIYDRERGGKSLERCYASAREILTARVTEEDIISGWLISEGSYLARVENKLGGLSPEVDVSMIFEDPITDKDLAAELIKGDKEHILPRIFSKYPLNCEGIRFNDARKLDGAISEFIESGSSSVELLERILALVRAPRGQNDCTPPIVESIIDYIKENISEDFSVSRLAEKMNISVYYMTHVFKTATGITITEYRT